MALRECPHCGNMISDKAQACPKCNHRFSADELKSDHTQKFQNENTRLSSETRNYNQENTRLSPDSDRQSNEDTRYVSDHGQMHHDYEYVPYDNDTKGKTKNNSFTLILIGVTILIIGGSILYALLGGKSNKPEDQSNMMGNQENDITAVVDTTVYDTIPPGYEDQTEEVKEPPRKNYKPLTQWYLVEVADYGVTFRGLNEIAKKLVNLGFRINSKSGSRLMASRGDTTFEVTYADGEYDEDSYITINFGSSEELEDFIDSMRRSKWEKSGKYYHHKDNNAAKVIAKVEGLRVTMVDPFEMAPMDF